MVQLMVLLNGEFFNFLEKENFVVNGNYKVVFMDVVVLNYEGVLGVEGC